MAMRGLRVAHFFGIAGIGAGEWWMTASGRLGVEFCMRVQGGGADLEPTLLSFLRCVMPFFF
jgi:hypothetical protein